MTTKETTQHDGFRIEVIRDTRVPTPRAKLVALRALMEVFKLYYEEACREQDSYGIIGPMLNETADIRPHMLDIRKHIDAAIEAEAKGVDLQSVIYDGQDEDEE